MAIRLVCTSVLSLRCWSVPLALPIHHHPQRATVPLLPSTAATVAPSVQIYCPAPVSHTSGMRPTPPTGGYPWDRHSVGHLQGGPGAPFSPEAQVEVCSCCQ